MPRKATITSEEVREALDVRWLQIVDAIKATLDDCSTELVSDLVDNGLVLAGGGALLRGLDQFLSDQTGLPTRLCGEPLAAVARGTCICLEHFDRLARRDAHQRRGCVRPLGTWLARQLPWIGDTWLRATGRRSPIRPAAGCGGFCRSMAWHWGWCWLARSNSKSRMARTFAGWRLNRW